MTELTHCPVCKSECGSVQAARVVKLENIPLYCNILALNQRDALNSPRGVINLVMCQQCGHFYNSAFDARLVEYSDGYEATLFHSKSYRAFARETVSRIIEKYGIKGKRVLEIGCGDGQYLGLMSELGGNTCVGLDPGRTFDDQSMPVGVQLKTEYFNAETLQENYDLLVCRHVLEHLEKPQLLMHEVIRSMQYNPDAVLYFEVPNALFTIEELGIWDLIYEHLSYFTPFSIGLLFEQNNLCIKRLDATYQSQFLSIEAVRDEQKPLSMKWTSERKATLTHAATAFKTLFSRKVDVWRANIAVWRNNQQKVVIWGTGSKGVTFLNLVDEDQYIIAAVDINPAKEGKYVVGTGHPVVRPSELSEIRPDVVIIMNAIYENEIVADLATLNLHPEIRLV